MWELARRRGFGTPAGSGCLIRDMIVQDSRDDSPVFITPPSGFYLRKLLAWPGFGFYLHRHFALPGFGFCLHKPLGGDLHENGHFQTMTSRAP